MKKDNAFTGLEAAIVLIAFVVVAAIFSYVMLGAGFFATQKAQEVTYSAVKQTTSNLIPGGTIYGNMSATTGANLELIQISLSVPVGGQSQQLKDLMMTYSAEGDIPANVNYNGFFADGPAFVALNQPYTFQIAACTTGVVKKGDTTTDNTDDSILVPPGNSCNAVIYIGTGPTNGEWFQLEIKPPVGAPTTLRKTIPTGYKGGKLL